MSRTTRAQLDALGESVSRLLPEGVAVSVVASSGRKLLQLLHSQGEGAPWHVVRDLRAGTAGAMYEYLLAMREALCLVQDGPQLHVPAVRVVGRPIGIPYAEAGFHPETGEPVRTCPICGELCPFRADEDGETVMDTYPDHYARHHGQKEAT